MEHAPIHERMFYARRLQTSCRKYLDDLAKSSEDKIARASALLELQVQLLPFVSELRARLERIVREPAQRAELAMDLLRSIDPPKEDMLSDKYFDAWDKAIALTEAMDQAHGRVERVTSSPDDDPEYVWRWAAAPPLVQQAQAGALGGPEADLLQRNLEVAADLPVANATDDPAMMPASWFKEEFGIPADRLWSAWRRRSLRSEKRKGRRYYSAPDARHLWPHDVTYLPGETRR